MSQFSIELLGSPEVRRNGVSLRFRSRKELALLLYLATEGGTHTREKLVELFWPRSGESRGRANLRNALSSLRKTLFGNEDPENSYLMVERYHVSFDLEADIESDLGVLEAAETAALLGAGGSADGDERSRVVARLLEAVMAHRGEFLEGFYLDDAPEFDHWADMQRESWRRHLGAVYDQLIRLQMEGGEFSAAIKTARRWVKREPSEENAHRSLIEAYVASGDRQAALAAFESYRGELEKGLGVTPGPEIEALAARIRSETAVNRPAPGHRFRAAGEPVSLNVPLVGRSEEFGALVAEYHAAREGGPRSVAVIGEAGIGKTRLVNEFLSWAEAQGADVLRALAVEGGDVPYGPMLGALRERIERERAPDDLLDDFWLAELSRLLPEIRDRYPDLPPSTSDSATSKAQLFEAIHRLMMALAAQAKPEPVVLFIDDLQWVDNASLELRQYEWRRWDQEKAPLLIVTTIREEALEFDTEVSRRFANAGRDMPMRRLSLEPLGPEDTTDLVGALTSGGTTGGSNGATTPGRTSSSDHEVFGRWLYGETDGQPFFLMETLEDLLDRGILVPSHQPDGGHSSDFRVPETGVLGGVMPAGVRNAVKGRLSRLGGPATKLLAAGAVLGRGFSYEVLFRVAQLDEEEGLAALDETLSNRLLREPRAEENFKALDPSRNLYPAGSEYDYVFSHDKIREVVYTEAGEARRRVFHRRALEALEEEGVPAAGLARHARAAGLPEQAFQYSSAAGDEAMALFAVEDAAQQYQHARALYEDPRSGRRVRRAGGEPAGPRLYERLGNCYRLLSRWTEALDAYERMLVEAREADDQEAEWEALNNLAMLGTDYTVQPEEEDELFRGMQRGARDQGEPETGTDTPQDFAWSPGYARDRAEEALSLARETGREDLIANSLYAAALLDGWSGRWERVADMCAEARPLYAATGGRALEAEILGLSAWGEVMEGRPQEAARFGQAQLAVARELDDRDITLADAHGLILALLETGEYQEALSLARRSAKAARSLGASERLQVSLTVLGDAHKALLQIDEAREVYSGLSSLVVFPQYRALAHSKLCAVAALEGDWEEAHDHALQAAKLRGEISLQLTDPFHRHREIEALLRGGDEDSAREVLGRFGEHTAGKRRLRISYLRAQAVLNHHTGDTTAAVEHLREAEELSGEIGLPGELWQIRTKLGELHEESGDPEGALRFFSLAAQTIQTLAGKIDDEELRSGFLGAAPIRRVLEKTPAH